LGTNINSHEKQKLPLQAGLQDWAMLFKKGESTPINHGTVFQDHPIRRCQFLLRQSFPAAENFIVGRLVSNQYFPDFHAVQFRNFFYFPASAVGKSGDDETIIEFYTFN
jgi:hypothetical protein